MRAIHRKILIHSIVVIILSLSYGKSIGQQTFPIGNKTGLNLTYGGYAADSAQRLPWRPAAFSFFDSTGRVYYNRYGDSSVYVHNGLIWKKLAFSGGVISADSLIFSTRYRNDTGNSNIRAQIAALPPTDSAVFQTKYRSDTNRNNVYAYIGSSQALDVKYTDSNAVYFTKYRSDTMRTNLYSYIASKGTGTVISVIAGTGLSGGTITTTGTISMPNVGTAATYGSSTQVPVFTTDAQGRVSAVTNTSIAFPATDSSVFQTKYRSDTGRTNIYAYVGSSQATDVKYTDSATIYFTKYRSDTMRAGIYAYIATKGAGTATTFSSGNMAPLFTTTVTNPTTTPALTYTLTNASAHTFFGNFTGSTGAPSYSSPALASADFANQGTTTTLLHGNAAGNPSFTQVNLADLSATGTPSSSSFLRGDYTWQPITSLATTLTAGANVTLTSGTNAYTVAVTASVTPTASTIVKWDANVNISSNNYNYTRNSAATSAVTTTLTGASSRLQVLTGTTAGQGFTMPVTSAVGVGFSIIFYNNSTQVVNINSSGGNLIFSIPAGCIADVHTKTTGATTAADWEVFLSYQYSTTPIANSINLRDADGCSNMTQVTTSTDFTITINKNQQLVSFLFAPNTGSQTLKVGTTAGGVDVIPSTVYSSTVVAGNTVGVTRTFSISGATTLYVSGFSATTVVQYRVQ